MDSSTERRKTTNRKYINVIRRAATCGNVAYPSMKVVKQPVTYMNTADKSVKTVIGDNTHNSKYYHAIQPSTVLTNNENDVIDLCEKDVPTREVTNSIYFGATNQEDASEVEDDTGSDTGSKANLIENHKNTRSSTNGSHSSKVKEEKKPVTVPQNCDNRGLGAQPKENVIRISNIHSKAINCQYAVCSRCLRFRQCKFIPSMKTYVCMETCYGPNVLPGNTGVNVERQSVETALQPNFKICSFCNLPNVAKKITVTWETMEFCCVECLSRYQIQRGSFCSFCQCLVKLTSMGKFAVRIGFEIRQFCTALCLEKFKEKNRLCRHCQVTLPNDCSFIRFSIDPKESNAQEFCSESCVEIHKLILDGSKLPPVNVVNFCTVCASKKPVEIQVIQDSELISLCSYICFKTFRFANSMDKISHCNVCKKFFPPGLPNSLFLYHNGFLLDFCCKICHNVFLLMRRKIVSCFWCKVKKYDHDMIEQTSAFSEFGGGCVIVCSIHCLTLYQVSLRTSTKRQLKCDWCSEFRLAQVNIIMSDTSTRHFCSYECATNFRGRHGEMPSIVPKKDKPNTEPLASESSTPSGDPNNVATSVDLPSASPTSEECSTTNTKLPETELALGDKKTVNSPTKCVRQIILKPPEPKSTTNKFAQCNPSTNDGECQTDEFLKYPPVLPIPVPIYVPFPVPVYGAPIFVPIKIPQPYPVPVLIPTSKKTYQSIILQKKITPADSNNGSIMKDRVLAVTGEHRLENCSSESDDHIDNYPADGAPVEFSSLSQDDSENFTQTEKLVLNKSIAEILHNFDQESEEERATQDRVVDSEVEEASNVIRVRPETQTKDDGGKVCQLVKMDIDEKPDKTLKTNQKTENKCTTQNSVVEVEAKPVSASLEPLAQTKGDGEKVSEIWKPIVKDFVKTMRSLPKPKHENAIQITDESVSKPSSNLMRPGIQIKDDGEETPDRTVELGRKILNKEPSKIMPTQQKTENKHATSNPDDELERIKQESYSSNPFKPCSEKSQQQKRKSESTEGPSISKKSRPEHSASTKSENRQISKALPLTKASCSSMVEAKQANAGPSISIKSRPGHVTSRKSEYNQISKSLPLTNVSSSSIVEAKQAFVGPSVSKKSRPEHSTSTKSVNRQLFKSPPLTNVSSSSVVEAKQVNVGPSISKKSRPEHSTSTKSENRLISKSLPLTNVSSSSTVEVKQADADPPLSLKVSEGLSVWKKWLTATNTKIKIHAYLKKKVPKVFSTNILKLTIGELNYLLCRFVREIRQPNGTEYAADYIYYLCLCIQRYLFENGCIHNIFVESSYQPFVDALDKVARKFSQCSLTGAVEEELLWECEQLGGHSPYILVATLLFFNTKFFKLFTVEEHMRLSFSSITRMKKRCSSSSPSSNRTVVVRFSPPSALGAPKSQSKTYYDVREDRENVLRCPVRLYEFYLSKCHASVRQRNDVFYLQPVGNCPPDCPVWFSTAPLSKDVLVTMLHRIQMVKEINKPRLAS